MLLRMWTYRWSKHLRAYRRLQVPKFLPSPSSKYSFGCTALRRRLFTTVWKRTKGQKVPRTRKAVNAAHSEKSKWKVPPKGKSQKVPKPRKVLQISEAEQVVVVLKSNMLTGQKARQNTEARLRRQCP